ncbi:MAG: pYEATS domain-containing protein [Pirellulales bacterium]
MSDSQSYSSNGPSDQVRNGRIITFYSYKGGTGRTMSLANVAWILASQGKRVLVMDWDLEAPGLHRYFRPFLEDPELAQSLGLIEFFQALVEGARRESIKSRSGINHPNSVASDSSEAWFMSYVDWLPYVQPIDYEFNHEGCIDLLPAGRQGPAYGSNVSTFRWDDFYDKLGGGVFLEVLKNKMREEYDYILLDSRTGLADTAGICTVQMPDELVVCFTLNRQSILGASAVARSASDSRLKPSGEPGLKVWPVPTRVETAEKERLDWALDFAHQEYSRFLWHLRRDERETYWGRSAVYYVPFYAYDEQLATVFDRPHQSASLLASMEFLTGCLTGGQVTAVAKLSSSERHSLMARYSQLAPTRQERTLSSRSQVLLVYNRLEVARFFELMTVHSQQLEISMELFGQLLPSSIAVLEMSDLNNRASLDTRLTFVDAVVVVVGPESPESEWLTETLKAVQSSKIKCSVVATWLFREFDRLRSLTSGYRVVHVDWNGLRTTRQMVDELLEIAQETLAISYSPDDPQKGCWGGLPERAGRRLSAEVWATSANWFAVNLRVESIDNNPLTGDVIFHLHPTFSPDTRRVETDKGAASLRLHCTGAFTVGVETDGGQVRLELDLSELSDAPVVFRDR